MPERFWGPWRIELNAPVVNATGFRQAQAIITASQGADGAYDLPTDPNIPFALDVDGSVWDLDIAIYNSQRGYQAFGTKRTTGFDRVDGLVAIIEVGTAPTRLQPFSLFYVKLRCVSTDPNMQPGDPTDLYDFSLPRG